MAVHDIFKPKRVDIFKDENIIFDDGNFEGDLILRKTKENETKEE
jgi:hypothetical protein